MQRFMLSRCRSVMAAAAVAPCAVHLTARPPTPAVFCAHSVPPIHPPLLAAAGGGIRCMSGGSDVLPGDWICPNCSFKNFATRTVCRSCNAPNPTKETKEWRCPACTLTNSGTSDTCVGCSNPRSEDQLIGAHVQKMRPGDWTCPKCSEHNFSRRTNCRACSTEKPSLEATAAASMPVGESTPATTTTTSPKTSSERRRPGDWNCPACNEHNFASRNHCRNCGTQKKTEVAPGGMPQPAAAAARSKLGGDWTCPSCGAMNFARRAECYTCRAKRPIVSSAQAPSAVPQEWSCPLCHTSNGTSQSECLGCGGARPAVHSAHLGSVPQSTVVNDRPFLSGDWRCPSCSTHNFKRRSMCFKCGETKTASSDSTSQESAPAEDASASA